MILGSAMVVDILSMISLTFVIIDFSLSNIIYMVILIVLLIFIKKLIVPIFSRYKGNRFEFELKFMLLVLIALGLLAEEAGLHSALIAFLTGVIFSNIEPEHEQIMEKLNTVVFSLLAPIFFFHAGSLLTFGHIDLATFTLFIIFLVIAVVGKYIGTFAGIYISGIRDMQLVKYCGMIFNFRLSFGIVTGMYAYEKNLIDIRYLDIILLVVGISSIIAVLFGKMKGFKNNESF
jgi:Kef-type K+ transport system membrane component KefB